MRKLLIVCLAAPATLYAQSIGPGLKPGLWEMQVVRQVVDGRDVSAQRSEASRQMQQAMKDMPPEQRARMAAMMRQHGVSQGTGGGYRICLTQEMASRGSPIIDRKGRCRTSKVTRNGNRTTFAFSCSSGGTTTSGTGAATMASDRVTTRTEATTQSANGERHTVQVESKMTYVGPDCGDVQPPGEER